VKDEHRSAIATLSVNVGNCRAFYYGVRWGVGHSIGLVLVGSFFIVLENISYSHRQEGGADDPWEDDDRTDDADINGNDDGSRSIEVPERIESIAECFVGVFMLALGLYNLFRAHRKEREMTPPDHHHGHGLFHHHQNHGDRNSLDPLTTSKGVSSHIYSDGVWNESSTSASSSRAPNNPLAEADTEANFEDVEGDVLQAPESLPPMEIDDPRACNETGLSRSFLSLCIGIVHGVAGPGGVLGVIPAVRLHNFWHSIVYLGSFCASSIVVMGCFAASYGSLSSALTQGSDVLVYRMEVFSASLSALVGCTWLILLYLGKLHDVFP